MDNRRKTIVINKKFQYQYSLLIAALAVLLLNGFLIVQMLSSSDQAPVITSSLTSWVGLVEIILIGGIWYGSLKASHRIAGPVFVFAREIERLGNGDLQANVVLRDTDMFQPEAEQINRSIQALKGKISALQSLSSELKSTQAGGGDIGSLLERLDNELSAFETSNEGSE
jgi:methyl-accepting chemotaxis protein